MKYGPNASQRLRARGADVVGHEVEDHGEPGGVGGVDEPREALGPAVAATARSTGNAVVAPAALAGELRDGHDLDDGDAELREPGRCSIAASNVPACVNVPMCSS